MINLKVIGAAVLLAATPVLMSSADARPGGGGGHGGGGGFSRGGGGGGFAIRGGGGANFAARPNFGGARAGGFAAAPNVAAGTGAFAARGWRPVGALNGPRYAGNWNGQRPWRGRYWGPGIGFAAGLAAGSAYAYGYPYYDDSCYYGDSYAYAGDDDAVAAAPATGDDAAYCSQRYRSYDPASGTYLGYDGVRHPCP